MSADGVNFSEDLAWELTRKNSSYLIKQTGLTYKLSRDPLNPKGVFSPRFQGSTRNEAATVLERADKKGVVLVYKNDKAFQPGSSQVRKQIKNDVRRMTGAVKTLVNKSYYREDLKRDLLRRASAIARSQNRSQRKGKAKKN